VLRLLDGVSWADRPVTGARSQALLAALAAEAGHPVPEAALTGAVWGADEQPAAPGKALQVVVSRTRAQSAPEVVVRTPGGYRLGVGGDDLDVATLVDAVRDAARAESGGDHVRARDRARAALDVPVAGPGAGPALDGLRDRARSQRADAAAVLGRSLSLLGSHDEALGLLLEVREPDETTLAALLRSEAAVHGAPVALARYAAHREQLRDRLGIDPGPALQAVHAGLLASDAPVRSGLRYDATPLVGRDDDVRRLRELVAVARVTSIVGAGGLGKTRLAQVLARGAEQPVVHLVELAGVASPQDVLGEIGSALGVRDSVSGRRVLAPEQRADLRGRLAQQLGQAPTLLVLDNCEHVVEAVADLVAPWVAATRDLRVVTTSRIPLGIAAERVLVLDQLDADAGVELFTQRAEAARPGLRLDPDAVRRVVTRLDGLPLAIELAAARVRAMSVADLDRRLDDRFALLRGHDRSAPDRHRTLLAVIEWSWDLLDEADRRALRWLAVFPDGFSLEGAGEVLGDDALAAVESLAGQSLLTVRDDGEVLRYRMLETVREFGRRQLADAGEEPAAREALRTWATGLCADALGGLHGPDQVAVVTRVATEDATLTDVLRQALDAGDAAVTMVVLAALGEAWTIRGEHLRVMAVLAAVEDVLEGWEPGDHLLEPTAHAAAVLVLNTTMSELVRPRHARDLLDRYGPVSRDPRVRALQRLLPLVEGVEDGAGVTALLAQADDPDRTVAALALQWASHALENSGDPEAAAVTARRAVVLWREDDGVFARAWLHTQLAGLYAQLGRIEEATPYAEAGLPVLLALGADDDAVQLRAVLARAALAAGRLDDARRLVDQMEAHAGTGLLGGAIAAASMRAELALAAGDAEEGLRLYDRGVAAVRALRFPGFRLERGMEPWTLVLESTAVAAQARYGVPTSGAELHGVLAPKIAPALAADGGRLDFPVAGSVLFALGAWALLRDDAAEDAVTLLALADRFAYSRWAPSMAWDPVADAADRAAPGRLAAAVAAYGDRRGADVLDDARAAVAHIFRE